jgi:cytochrome c oxidase subunit 2
MKSSIDPYEKFWIGVAVLCILGFIVILLWSSFLGILMPPSHMEIIDPTTVLSGNPHWKPGVTTLPDGSIQVVVTARTWSFLPSDITVPANKKIIFRVTSADVVHGFDIVGTDVNLEVVPGYVSQESVVFKTPGKYLLLCDEYCGIEHHTMAGTITVKGD